MSDSYQPRRDRSGSESGRRPRSSSGTQRSRSGSRRPSNSRKRSSVPAPSFMPRNPYAVKAIYSALFVVILLLITVLAKGGTGSKKTDTAPADTTPVETAEPTPTYTTATLGFTGDIVGHKAVSLSGQQADGTYDYSDAFEYAETAFDGLDYLMGNLETTLSATEITGNPTFASPDGLAYWLKDFGYDMLTTANNHCLDKGFDGLVHTIETLDDAGLEHVGTYASEEEYNANHGVLSTEVNGITIAFLDYTYGTNFMTVDNSWEVNEYNTDSSEFNVVIDTDRVDADMEYARGLNTDLIIVCMHWGIEYETTENEMQDEMAEYLIARGADAVVGGHAHVPQPFKYVTTTDAETGESVTGFVCFSLGNLFSNQHDEYTNYTAVLRLGVTKEVNSGETTIDSISYTPLYLLNRGDGASPQYIIMDTLNTIAEVDDGTSTNPYITTSLYSALQTSLTDLEGFFGSEWEAMTPALSTADSAEIEAESTETPAETESAEETPAETATA